MNISIIVAMDKKGVIGIAGELPWRLPADLIHFKEITMGKPLIMGRKTHESIGRSLPGRKNIVVSHSQDFKATAKAIDKAMACVVVNSLDEALDEAMQEAGDVDEIMIIGGAGLYGQMLEHADRLYLTEVRAEVEGDVYFPEFDKSKWKELEKEEHTADEKNEFDYSFVVLERV